MKKTLAIILALCLGASMLAACGAQGLTILDNPAREPEIVDLQNFLRCLGARVEGRCFRQEA